MPPIPSDRNLLFGILALQLDFIDRDRLIAAMQAWALDKGKSLGTVLVAQGALASERHQLLEALVLNHLEMHDGNLQRSLAALSSIGSAKKDLEGLHDPDVAASLAVVGQDHSTVPISRWRP